MYTKKKYALILIFGILISFSCIEIISISYTYTILNLEYKTDYFTLVDNDSNYFGNEDYDLNFKIDMSESPYCYRMVFTPHNKSKSVEIIERSLSKEIYENQWEDPFIIDEKEIRNFTVSRGYQDNQTGFIEDTGRYIQIKPNKKVRCYTIITEKTTPNNISNLLYVSEAENICVFAAFYGNDSFMCNLFNFTYFDIRIALSNSNPEIETENHFSFSWELGFVLAAIFSFVGLFVLVRVRRKKSIGTNKSKKMKIRRKKR